MTEIYLDNGATSFPKPERVYEGVNRFMREVGGSPARGSYSRAQESERMLVKLRSRLAQFLGVSDPANLVFTANATDALNLAIKGLLSPGDHVVTTDLEHNAVLRPLWALHQSCGVEFTVVPSSPAGTIDPDDMIEAITPRTRLVVCVHASNVLGTVQPVGELAQKLKPRGIPLLIDGSQAVGAMPVDIERLGADLYAFTGHKSLLGPPGTGGLYVSRDVELRPLREGGTGTLSESLEQPSARPDKYESGTPNMAGLAGLLEGIEFLRERGVEKIREHEVRLNRMLMESLRTIPGIVVYGPDAEQKVGITSINFENLDTTEAGQILCKKFGIMVRTGLHCSPLIHRNIGTSAQGTVRFSLGWANTLQEMEKVSAAVREIAAAIYAQPVSVRVDEKAKT